MSDLRPLQDGPPTFAFSCFAEAYGANARKYPVASFAFQYAWDVTIAERDALKIKCKALSEQCALLTEERDRLRMWNSDAHLQLAKLTGQLESD